MIEKIRKIGAWLKKEKTRVDEYREFESFFPASIAPNGILTKSGEQMHPLLRGLMTAKGSFRLMGKYLDHKSISPEERGQVREAAWITSISGDYSWRQSESGDLQLKIFIENPDASDYLSANTDVMVVFLCLREEKDWRYKKAVGKRVEKEQDKSYLIFDFPQVKQIPQHRPWLHIYTRPVLKQNVNEKFLRLSLVLF